MKLILKARFFLLLALAMQASALFKGLHHHEQVCLLTETDARSGREVLHAHSGEHEACAWDAFQLSAEALALPVSFHFLIQELRPAWAPLFPEKVTLFLQSPQGRAPPVS